MFFPWYPTVDIYLIQKTRCQSEPGLNRATLARKKQFKTMQNVARNRNSFIDQLNPFVNRIFQHAILQGDMAVVTLMLKHGIVVKRNQRNPYGLTALQQSVLDGNNRLVMKLLESGADLEAKTSNGWTSLHIASATGDVRLVKLLLTHCADVVALTKNEELPIDLAMNTDMKILLANEMSRCGYIELSQWYIGRITQQAAGIFYVMSADSLIEIACERPESVTNATYDFYHQHMMHTYSSMINLSRNSTSDMNLACHKRKASACSASKAGPSVTPAPNNASSATSNDGNLLTIPVTMKEDHSATDKLGTIYDHPKSGIRKSKSSTSMKGRSEPTTDLILGDEQVSKTSQASNLCTPCTDKVAPPSVGTAAVENGTIGRTHRKQSLRRRPSEIYLTEQDRGTDDCNRLEVTIDYYQNSFEYDGSEDDDEGREYLEFKRHSRKRLDSSTSSSSIDTRGSFSSRKDSFIVHEYGHNDEGIEIMGGNRELLQEFADPNNENSQFEIDTDKMDQYIINSDGSVDQIMEDRLVHEDEGSKVDETSARNMYFNPMYKSADLDSTGHQLTSALETDDGDLSLYSTESDQDIQLDWKSQDTSSAEYSEQCGGNERASKVDNKPHEIYLGETKLICDETELYERKRKKKSLLSELVSKFKRGSSKMQRTSSDTNLRNDEQTAVLRRDTRKVKTLRRRRHVRRSNSFSSYFTQGKDKCAHTVTKQHETNVSKSARDQNGSNKTESHTIDDFNAPPYMPHRIERLPLSAKEHTSNLPDTEKYYSLPRRTTHSGGSLRSTKNVGMLYFEDSQDVRGKDARDLRDIKVSRKDSDAENGFENGISRIPKRSINTYSKGMRRMNEGDELIRGCVSKKLLCK
eukprot:Seg1402.2 transcript_id=Seg1402.2/GoldUCD/mRNA.D3Y31 product="Protein phosphatase 1 regulatory subunit 12C" protein_id=Seg1402.2/GoldUCD/D3Y31